MNNSSRIGADGQAETVTSETANDHHADPSGNGHRNYADDLFDASVWDPPELDFDQAAEFVRVLYDDSLTSEELDGTNGALVCLTDANAPKRKGDPTHGDADQLVSAFESADIRVAANQQWVRGRVNSGYSIYVSVNRFRGNRRLASDVTHMLGVWADLDIKDGAFSSAAEIDNFLASLDVSANLVVDSGSGGRNVIWLFDRPLIIGTDDDRARAKALERQWVGWLQERAGAFCGRSVKLDRVTDLNRVLRLPGMIRQPKASDPQPLAKTPVRLLVANSDQRYPADTIESICGYTPGSARGAGSESSYVPVANGTIVNASDPRVIRFVWDMVRKQLRTVADERSERNNVLNVAAYVLGGLGAYGLLDETDIGNRLYLSCQINNYLAEHSESSFWATFASGWSAGMDEPIRLPADVVGAGDSSSSSSWEADVQKELRSLNVKAEAKRRFRIVERGPIEVPDLTKLDELLAEPDEEVPDRIAGVLPLGAKVLLAAPQKAGKTTLVGNLVRSLADGVPFLGRFDVDPVGGTVALLDTEMDRRMLRKWHRDFAISEPDKVLLCSLYRQVHLFDILDDDVLSEWSTRLRTAGVDVLVIDCLSPILAALGLDENLNRDFGVFANAIERLTLLSGVGELVITHHFGHNGERSRGASRMRGWPDVEWQILRGRGDDEDDPASGVNGKRERYFWTEGRGETDVDATKLEFDPLTRSLSLGAVTRTEATVKEGAEKFAAGVWTLTQEGHEEPNQSQVRDIVKIRKERISAYASEAVRRGFVSMRLDGTAKRYRLTALGTQHADDEGAS